jgi:hypothetical protein
MDDIRGSSLNRAWVARSGLGPTPPLLFWASWPPSLTSCALEDSRDKILTPKKFQVNLSLKRFLKCKKYTKHGFPVLSYNQNKGDRWKILINHYTI